MRPAKRLGLVGSHRISTTPRLSAISLNATYKSLDGIVCEDWRSSSLYRRSDVMLVIDKLGRKTMLLIDSIGTCTCLAMVSLIPRRRESPWRQCKRSSESYRSQRRQRKGQPTVWSLLRCRFLIAIVSSFGALCSLGSFLREHKRTLHPSRWRQQSSHPQSLRASQEAAKHHSSSLKIGGQRVPKSPVPAEGGGRDSAV
jgi:hypothetical protein